MDGTFRLNIGGHYDLLVHEQAGAGSVQKSFGTEKVCRFCNTADPSKFKKIAHLIPEGLGNHWLISLDECDPCNEKFSEYESHLVSAVRPILTISGTAGKGDVGQTGRTASGSYIRHGRADGRRQLTFMTSAERGPKFGVNVLKNSFSLSYPVPAVPFKPRLAYKALVKMGYALLPAGELQHFTKLRDWLGDRSDDVEFPCLETCLSLGSIGNAPAVVSAALLKRSDPAAHLPYMIFLLCAGSVCLQIDLMTDSLEDHLGWGTMGQVKIEWAIEMGSDERLRIEYGKPHPMNWSSPASQPQPLEELTLHFNPATQQGRFTKTYRPQWR
jgi:hypothetical protein